MEEKPVFDERLYREVELRATGADIHRVRNTLQKYYFLTHYPEAAAECPRGICKVGRELEKALRRYVSGVPLRDALRDIGCGCKECLAHRQLV